MKRIKIGVVIIFLTVAIYFIVSYSIFLMKKPLLDTQIQLPESHEIIEKKEIPHIEKPQESVVVQNIIDDEQISDLQDISDAAPTEFIVIPEPEKPLPIIEADIIEDFIVKSDKADNKKTIPLDSYSFVTMPIVDGYTIDQETQDTLDVLIGKDLDEFVRLVLQSNNNVVSKEACRSCGMYAFFSSIQKHQKLATNEIVILQKTLVNLYQFVEKMKLLSKKLMMRPEQYVALQDLNRSQAIRNDMKLQARRAATSAALKKLQAIQYNR